MRLSWHWVKLFPYLQNLNLRNKKKGLVPRLHESYCEKLTQIWDALIVITGPCLIQFNSKILYSLIVAIFGLFLFWAVWNAWMICGIVTDLMLFWNLMVEDFFFFYLPLYKPTHCPFFKLSEVMTFGPNCMLSVCWHRFIAVYVNTP